MRFAGVMRWRSALDAALRRPLAGGNQGEQVVQIAAEPFEVCREPD